MTDLITKEAVAFLQRSAASARAGKPLFLYVPYTAPHSPYQGPGDRRPKPLTEAQWNEGTRAGYVELVEHMDAGVGKILAAIDKAGLADNTLVFFVSDNGGNKKARNLPYSGHKSSLYEGGIHVPCIVRWPGVLPRGATADQAAITMDLTVSIVRAAGAAAPKDRPFDGVDILGEIQQKRPPTPRTLFWRARRGERTWRAVRAGDLKYLSCQDGQVRQEWLFDLKADPAEKADLRAKRPKDFAHLKALLARWEQEVKATR